MNLKEIRERVRKGGDAKYHEKNKQIGKMFARDRVELLCDKGTFVEDGLLANCLDEELPADGVVTGHCKVLGETVAIVANDSTVKAGSWGWRTVEKMVRALENARRLEIPVFYLVDSAGARITDQVEMFPGRRGAGRIFYMQSILSGKVPQICLLFGPSPAGGAYIPAFCDVVIMVEGNASMYLGSPRMVEMVIGEKVTLEELGGARMHCTQSGCGDILVKDEESAVLTGKKYFSYFANSQKSVSAQKPSRDAKELSTLIPTQSTKTYDMRAVIECLIDGNSAFEVKSLYAPEMISLFARIDGRRIGIVANQTQVKGGVIFKESAEKAARFIQLCDNYHIPLLFLMDVPGYMVGSKVEREGIIRAGARLIYSVSRASVPKVGVVLRKAYGAGLYAMAGPAFESDCVIALPSAKIAVMGPEPAVNAVYFNKMAEMSAENRKKFFAEKMAEYEHDVDIARLAGELVVDAMVETTELRSEIAKRFDFYSSRKHQGEIRGVQPM